jgi:pimeloyl-ACP methyl ester carboxylesterase
MRIVLYGIGVAVMCTAALAAALAAWLYWYQESLLFYPEPLPAGYVFSLAHVTEVDVPVRGARLSALHLRLPNPRGVLHGNAGNAASWLTDPAFYEQANYDLFMIDYRGYGKSGGRIQSEAQLRSDVLAAWEQVAPLYRGRRTVILGRSLGTALAAGLAAQVHPDLTILVSAYWSMTEMTRILYPWVPLALLRYRLETFVDVARMDGPLLLLHGEQDALIPVAHSARLQERAKNAQFVPVIGAEHNDLQDFAQYRDAIAQRLAAL